MPDSWLLVAEPAAQRRLAPLIETHAAMRPVRLMGAEGDWRGAAEKAAGVLFVDSRRRTPRDAIPGLFWQTTSGRRTPLGYLPQAGGDALDRFARAAAAVLRRPRGPLPLALLGQWDAEVLRTVVRSATILAEGAGLHPFKWTAERIIRRDLLTALRHGPVAALYFGHGRPYGWSGYHGLHSRHLVHARGEPLAALLSLTCNTAARTRGGGYGFAERAVLEGVAASALGAVVPTRTLDNWRWGLGICRELARSPHRPIGEILLSAGQASSGIWLGGDDYRLIGDPLAPLAAAPGALEACRAVVALDPMDDPARAIEVGQSELFQPSRSINREAMIEDAGAPATAHPYACVGVTLE